MKKRVMCFGTFDLLHPGHLFFLQKARAQGDELFVIIARDARRAKISGSAPVHSEKERQIMIEALKPVTKAILGDKKDMLVPLKKYKPAVVVLGHDQTVGVAPLMAWAAAQKNPPKIIQLTAYKRSKYSSSGIKKILCQEKK